MAEERSNIIYTAADIQKYLAGKMAPAEMHAIEKAALDDPFLADAIEGYQGMMGTELDRPLAFLKQQFSGDEHTKLVALKPSRRFTLWKAAAAILVICSGISITYFLSNKPQSAEKSIASLPRQTDTPNKSLDKAIATDTTNLPGSNNDVASSENRQEKTTGVTETAPLKDTSFMYRPAAGQNKKGQNDAGGGYVDDTQRQGRELASSNAQPTEQNSFESKQPLNNISLNKEKEEITSDKDSIIQHKFTGQVVTPENMPVPFANIIINNQSKRIYTDANGNFNLVSDDSLLNINIRSIGYMPRNLILRSNPSNNKIVLVEEDINSAATTISKAKIARNDVRRSSLLKDTLMEAEPEDGWNNYDAYINNSLSLSNEIPRKVSGDVEVSFDVQNNGAITNMKVDKSLCGRL
jgi:hypothetical protein